MNRLYGLTFLILECLLLPSAWSQDLTRIGKSNLLKVSGGVSANQIFYWADGIQNRRNPYSNFLSGNVNSFRKCEFQYLRIEPPCFIHLFQSDYFCSTALQSIQYKPNVQMGHRPHRVHEHDLFALHVERSYFPGSRC